MNNLKKHISILLCFIIVLSFGGCSKKPATVEPKPSTPIIVENNENSLVVDNNEVEQNTIENNEEVKPEVSEIKDSNDVSDIEMGKTSEPLETIDVNFIDVGQGDSSFIVTPNNDTILIDTGDSKKAEEVIECLEGYDFEDIDLLILTHPDADHINGAQKIIETYKIKEVVMCSFVKDTKVFNGILGALEERPNIKVTQGKVGMEYDIDGVHFLIVGVDSVVKKNGELSTANNSSVVTKMTYGDVSIMFMGDAEVEAEEVILNNGFDLSAQILKAGHHGSDTSSSQEMLDAINPKIAIISCGIDNKYGHPKQVTLDKFDAMGIKYYRTDEQGTIKLEIDGTNITTILNDSFSMMNMTAGRNFLFTPDVASVEIVAENDVLKAIENSEHK